jgi:hypothetical protein
VSTSGVVPMMERLAKDCPVALAVSLHAPTDPLRDSLVPLNKKYPLEELLRTPVLPTWNTRRATSSPSSTACSKASTTSPSRPMNWWHWCASTVCRCKFNLIPFNPFPQSGLSARRKNELLAFARVLSPMPVSSPLCARQVATTSTRPVASWPATCGTAPGVAERRIARQRTIMLTPVTYRMTNQGRLTRWFTATFAGIVEAVGHLRGASGRLHCWQLGVLRDRPPDETPPSADRIMVTRRTNPRPQARAHSLELAVGYFEQGQTTIALDELKQALAPTRISPMRTTCAAWSTCA